MCQSQRSLLDSVLNITSHGASEGVAAGQGESRAVKGPLAFPRQHFAASLALPPWRATAGLSSVSSRQARRRGISHAYRPRLRTLSARISPPSPRPVPRTRPSPRPSRPTGRYRSRELPLAHERERGDDHGRQPDRNRSRHRPGHRRGAERRRLARRAHGRARTGAERQGRDVPARRRHGRHPGEHPQIFRQAPASSGRTSSTRSPMSPSCSTRRCTSSCASEVNSIDDLKGRPVNFGAEGSGTEITGRLVFEALGIEVKQVHLSDEEALQKLKSGEIAGHDRGDGQARAGARQSQGRERAQAALPCLTPRSSRTAIIRPPSPMTIIPDLIPAGGRVDTVAVCAVLVSFNWTDDSAALSEDRPLRRPLLRQFRSVPEAAASSQMARGQLRRDARGLASLAARAELHRPRQGDRGSRRAAQMPRRASTRSSRRRRPPAERRCPMPSVPTCSKPFSNGARTRAITDGQS